MNNVVLRLTEASTLVLRQAHPSALRAGELTSAVFIASEQHHFILSTFHGRVGPEAAYHRHIATGLQSAGTWGLTVDQIDKAKLSAWEDGETRWAWSETADEDDGDDKNLLPKDHVSIPMNSCEGRLMTRKERERRARALKEAALASGRLFPPISVHGS